MLADWLRERDRIKEREKAARERAAAARELERARTETLAWYQQVKDQLPPGTPPGIDLEGKGGTG